MKAATPTQEIPIAAPVVRILKTGTCPSLSGKSTLTYHVGCNAHSEIQLRVFANSGGGFFSREWIALTAIEQAFSKVPSGIAITAHVLFSLYHGKSANSTGFLFAVLKSAGLVRSMKDKKGSYELTDANVFVAEVKALIASAVDLKVEEKVVNAPVEAKVVKAVSGKAKPSAAIPSRPERK